MKRDCVMVNHTGYLYLTWTKLLCDQQHDAKVEQSRFMLPGPYPGWIDHRSIPTGTISNSDDFSLNDVKRIAMQFAPCEAVNFRRKITFAPRRGSTRERCVQRSLIEPGDAFVDCLATNCRTLILFCFAKPKCWWSLSGSNR